MVKVSIIVPVKEVNPYLRECVEACKELDYPDFEIIVLPDEYEEMDGVKVLSTGPIRPSAKRDRALDVAEGQLLAFLDDDTIPMKDWLKNAVEYFDDEEVGAVGGPAVTPESDNILQQASGMVLSSFLGGGGHAFRYIPREPREVDDYPSCNFLIRRDLFESVGGFNTHYWPGEDTKLCLEVTKKAKKKILYAPDVVVLHHRRPLFKPHLNQIKSYALHRGFFAKRFPETSRRYSYFGPSIMVIFGIIGIPLAYISFNFRLFYIALVILYIAMLTASSLKSKAIKGFVLIFTGTLLTHVFYGLYFVKGLMVNSLDE